MKTQMRTHIRLHRCWEALVLAYLIFGFSASLIQAQPDSSCSQERSSRSAKTTQAVNATFTNRTKELLTVYWLDFEGKRQKWFDLVAGQSLEQTTYAGHLWLVAKREGQCVEIFSAPGNFVIGETQAPIKTSRPQPPPKQKTVQPAPGAAGQCPVISVSSPSEVEAGESFVFTASVKGVSDDLTPTYNWTLSAGIIMSGQGTSVISVEPYGDGQSITATVTIGGLWPQCSQSASSTTGVRPKPWPSRKFDEFGTLKVADLHSHLDNYAIQLQNEPMARAYVITYGGKTSTPTAAKTAGQKINDYLINVRGIEYSRIVLVDGGYRAAPFAELWIVPEERSTPPTASPTVDPKKAAGKRTTKKH